jgi:hypothetical protein
VSPELNRKYALIQIEEAIYDETERFKKRNGYIFPTIGPDLWKIFNLKQEWEQKY